MITKIDIKSVVGGDLELPLQGISSYQVVDIQGLQPVPASIVTSKFANVDGSFFQNAKGEERNIVLTLRSSPDYSSNETVGETRRALYPWFAPKTNIEFKVTSDDFATVIAYGWVESFETNIFSRDPEFQISIICPDPYLYAETNVVVTEETFDSRGDSLGYFLPNPGDVPVGFDFWLIGFSSLAAEPVRLSRAEILMPAIALEGGGSSGPPPIVHPIVNSMTYNGPAYSQGIPWAFKISTKKGQKSAKYTLINEEGPPYDRYEDPPTENVLGYIDDWMEVQVGVDRIFLTLDGNVVPPDVIEFNYRPMYLGL